MLFEEIEDREFAQKLQSRHNSIVYPEIFVKFKPAGCFLPREYAQYYQSIKEMEVRTDDVWVVSMMKAGTTWTQEMVWLLGQDLDYEGAKTVITERFPYVEFNATWKTNSIHDRFKPGSGPTSMEIVNKMPSPRYIKSHLPLNLLPNEILTKKPKIIYVARNPKDQCVSYYHHRVLFMGYKGTVDDLVDEFIQDLSFYSPYWTHIREFWEKRHEPNVHFITYESMKKDLPAVVQSMAKFLGKTLSESDFEKLLHHLSFESMKTNHAVNYDETTDNVLRLHGSVRETRFFRKGKVGSWKEELSAESVMKLNRWIAQNKIEGIWDDL